MNTTARGKLWGSGATHSLTNTVETPQTVAFSLDECERASSRRASFKSTETLDEDTPSSPITESSSPEHGDG